MEKFLNENIIDFKFSIQEYNKLLNNIIKSIKENKDSIEQANKIDLKHYNKQIDIEKLIETVELYRNDEIKNNQALKRYVVEYNGNIYLTVQICIWAILNKVQVVLDINNFLVGLNKIIVEIIKKEIKKYGINNLIKIYQLLDYEETIENKEIIDKIICIDEPEIYEILKESGIENIDLLKYNSIDLYCDDNDLVELRDMMCDFANNNNLRLEIYDDYNKNKVAEIIAKYGDGAIVSLLSTDRNLQNEFEEKIKNRRIFINKIPFDETLKIKF